MGMSYTGFGAPVTVKNLKVNADLDLGNYDLSATDVKGDTAEFDEFVGGVGNFTNVLGSGNLDIEGTGNVKGLTTFQNGVQVNGSLHVKGSINNVNIADNGEITTAQGVNGADFNGAVITSTKFNGATINSSGDYSGRKGTFSGAVTGVSFNGMLKKSGTYTVTPTNTTIGIVPYSRGSAAQLTLLPPSPNGIKYNGTVKFIHVEGSGTGLLYYNDGVDSYEQQTTITTEGTITLTNAPYLTISCSSPGAVLFYGFTLS